MSKPDTSAKTINQVAPPLILTLDIGSSSTRAMLFDRQARQAPGLMAQAPNDLQTTPDGGAEFDPEHLFNNVVEVIDRILAQAGSLADEIAAVAVDTFVTNILGVDQTGRPVTPVYTYADSRSAADAEKLRQEFDQAAVHNRTGCPVHSSYLPARFRWLARTQPDLLPTVAHWLSIGEYLFWRLFEERQVTHSVASWTGLLDRQNLSWDREWLAHLPLEPAHLSTLIDIDQPLQGLKKTWAERWPALSAVPWFPAVGDGAAANVGSGCTEPDRLALTIGTSGAMRVLTPDYLETVPDGLWLYSLDKRRALLGGATSEGGNIYAWLNEILKLPDKIEEALAEMPPAGHGLTMLPFVAGERAPGWQDKARAGITGLTLHTRPIDILRAGLESVAYRFALIHRRIAPHIPPDHQIIASGAGLLSSPVWLQIMADVLNRPLIASQEQEATSRGVALLALRSLGIGDGQPAAAGQTYHPRPEAHARYEAAFEAHLELYDRSQG